VLYCVHRWSTIWARFCLKASTIRDPGERSVLLRVGRRGCWSAAFTRRVHEEVAQLRIAQLERATPGTPALSPIVGLLKLARERARQLRPRSGRDPSTPAPWLQSSRLTLLLFRLMMLAWPKVSPRVADP